MADSRGKIDVPVVTGQILVALMMASLAVGLAQFGRRVAPNWHSGYLVWISLLLPLEAAYTRHTTREMEPNQRLAFRLSEWAAFAIVIKLLAYSGQPAQILADIPLWQENFFAFLDGEYLVAMLLALVVWFAGRAYAGEIEQIYDRDLEQAWDDLGKLQNALHEIRGRMAGRIFLLGGVVVILAVLARIDATALLRAFGRVMPGYNAPVANVLAYFIFGLVLLSQTQYAMLRTRWQWQKLPVSPAMPANWLRYSLIFFAILAGVVFFLPTEYSLGLFDTLRLAAEILFGLVGLVLMVVMLPLNFCLSLFRWSAQGPVSQPVLPPAPPPAPGQSAPADWLTVLRSLLFWVIFLVILYMVFQYYVRQNQALLAALRAFPLWRWLSQSLRALWQWLRGVTRQARGIAAAGIRRLRPPRAASPARLLKRMFSLQRLSPREKVIYYYLNLIKLGGEHGVARKPAQTPYQYEAALAETLPEVDHELLEFTDTFIEARYSQHPVEEPHAQQANSLWEKVKNAFQRLRKPE